jgi:sugar lactone lactonase YvrE
MPDYRPAFSAGATRADGDGNLWIRTSTVFNGAQVYDVVNGSSKLIDRVQLPAGRTIAAFGKGGVIYLAVRDGTTGVRLEKASIR